MISNHPNVLGGAGLTSTTTGGATIVGTTGIAVTQIAYGASTNTIKGKSTFVFVEGGDRVQIGSTSGTRLLLGTNVDNNLGALQLATHTSAMGGLGIGDIALYRSLSTDLNIDTPNIQTMTLFIKVQGTQKSSFGTDGTNTILGCQASGGATRLVSGAAVLALTLDSSQNATFVGTITKPGGTSPLISTNTAITSGAGANPGTLTNSPTAGNPTKWVPINDNGTTRYIPAW